MQARARPDCSARALSGGKLEDRARAAAGSESPGPDVRRDVDYHEPPVEEDSIDRTAHEPCVNRCRGAKKKALTLVEWAPAEQAPETGKWRIGHEAPFTGDAAVGVLERYLH